eukprot:12696126-Alexandrium_andersonii.AAC.1
MTQIAYGDARKMAPVSRSRPPLVPCSKAESDQGQAALARQHRYELTRGSMCIPLAKPTGAPPKPGNAPAAGGRLAAPKTPPKAKPEPAAAAGGGGLAQKAEPAARMDDTEAFQLEQA